MKRVLLLFVALLVAAAGAAQEPRVADLRAETIEKSTSVELSRAWRFRPGDDPQWRLPGFDDRGWETVEPLMEEGRLPRGGWPGRGWFRRHVVVDSALAEREIVLRLEAAGAAEAWLDGKPLLRLSEGHDGEAGVWRPIRLEAGPHLFAVRYLCDCGSRTGPIGFRFILESREAAKHLSLRAAFFAAFTAAPAALGLLQLALFYFHRGARESLYAGLCMFSFALVAATAFADSAATPGLFTRVLGTAAPFAVTAAIFFGLMTYFALRCERLPGTWRWFAAGAIVFGGAGLPLDQPAETWAWAVYFVATIVEIVRTELREPKVRREGGGLMLAGMLILDLAAGWQVLVSTRILPAPGGFSDVYLVGLLGFSVMTSLFVARSYATTSLSLARKLEEVRALTGQVIAGERENARKGAEIEAARALQLALLPAHVPEVDGLEVAARVSTATEVGGDYYDFRVAEDGSLVVAIGDAAGHGVAAGAMVTATKALFASMRVEEDLASILSRCDRAIRGMNVRPLHMCLLLARVTPGSAAVCSAAMPRALHYRASSDDVVEIESGGLPLGSGLAAQWTEHRAQLAAGDVILFASDGAAESLSHAGEPLGYDRLGAIFRNAARDGAAAIVERVMEEAVAWRGDGDQTDDIALVAVRVR
jgi:serine phosphatase RsbU (regulator of sigma subunit)